MLFRIEQVLQRLHNGEPYGGSVLERCIFKTLTGE